MHQLLFTLLLLSVLIFGGCSDKYYVWYKPGATKTQINLDRRECLKKAKDRRTLGSLEAIREAELSGKPYVPYSKGFDLPYGYEKYRTDDDNFPRMSESYDINHCMKDKGYRQVLKEH